MVRSDSVWQMSITPQLPPIPLAQASAMLRAVAQANGSQVEARVLGPLPNGATQVQIGRQVMSLQLPTPQLPGTTLTLAVQQTEGQVRVTLVSAQPPQMPTASSLPPISTPATSVQLSAAALAGNTQAASPAPALAGANSPAVPSVAQPASAVATQPAGTAPASNATAGASPAPVPPNSAPASPSQAGPVPVPPQANLAARPAIPYPIAAAGVPLPNAGGPLGSATAALPPVSQPLASSVVGQHAAPTNGQAPQQGTSMPSAAPAVAPSTAPATPQAALSQMVQQALARQDSVVGLTTALTQVVARVALPEPVMKAAQQVLAQRLSLDGGGPDGATLQKAVRASGIFQEAMLAGGLGKAAGGDMKTALLGLQRQLGAWLGDQPSIEQVRSIPPPLRGLMPRARESLPLGDLPEEPHLAGKALLERTDAALSRLRLHQNASLPEPSARHEAQWSLDLPVVMGGQQSLLHIQIHRDRDADPEQNEERGWQVRFAINLSEMGEVGAQISLRGSATGILLWADREDTAAALAEGVSGLRQELEALGLNTGAIVVRTGAPMPPAASATSSGHIVDAVR